ncbi:AbiH family protein [Roseburia sp. MSJ-14]|uniref:AbiH family protein n=1 Tax=Roseburia sp. MSJ-14 TaxID=2841514 RepID=UPI001C104DBD|nr:AbiH family protein [Roseburia sp. MSJ-14]MBU5474897.1 bacteriophage abortive infection AbiH family protein [Roseburia sp. MSJ-14]
MKTLVLGNGFDIDHELPTKYKDFLCFVEVIKEIQILEEKGDSSSYILDTELKKYVYNLLYLDDKKKTKFEVLSLLESNVWIDYFLNVKGEFGENWIDFEAEISHVVQELENVKDYVIDEMRKGVKVTDVPDFMKKRLDKLSPNAVGIYKDGNEREMYDFISKWVNDLKRMIHLLEIYLDDYVQKIKIACFSPDIYELNPDRVISFNYTNTYEKIYSYKRNGIKYNYIHGKSSSDSSVDTCNMVLGIDEYLDNDRRNQKTEFIQFKKYFQRIHKKTDCEYVYWFDKELRTEKSEKNREEVFIFGHSLDITDGDVLSTIINCPNTYVTIFYHDDVDYGKQITNLVSLLGQDIMLSKVYGKNPSIIFKHQQEHRLISNSEFEVASDMYKLRNLYEYNNVQAQEIVNGVINKIENCNISYFENQKNVVNMYDILQELGLAEENRSKLLSFAKVIYDDKLLGQKVHIDASQWEYEDYDGHYYCDSKTEKFINEINEYNLEQYEKYVFPIQNESDEEEMYLLYPNKVKDGYSIDDYEKTFQYALNKINSTATDTRKVLNALCTIALHLDSEDVKKFYRAKKKSSKNPILQSRINYIMSCYEEDLYMEYQARQYEESVNDD